MLSRRNRRGAPLVAALAAALIAAAADLAIGQSGPFRRLEGALLDLRFRLLERSDPDPAIVLVLIDDKSLSAIGRWPWPRGVMADFIDRLSTQRPRAIALDILFADRDPEGDAALAAAMGRAGNVALAMSFGFEPQEPEPPPEFIARAAYAGWRLDGGHTQVALEASAVLAPIPELARAAAALGHVNIAFDTDGAARYAYPALAHAGSWQPSLPVALARLHLGLAPHEVWLEFGRGVHVGDRFLPTDEAMRAPIAYRPPGQYRSFSFVDVLEGRAPAGAFDGAAVLVGASAHGLGDAAPTPYGAMAPGVERHAMTFESLIGGFAVVRRDALALVDAGLILAFGAALGTAAGRAGVAGASVAFVALLLALLAGNTALFLRAGVWLNLFAPAFALALIYAAAALSSHATLAGDRRAIRDAFRRYLHPRLVEELAREPGLLRLGGEMRELTTLFADIRDSTALAERLPPERLVRLLNRYFTAMTDVVHAEDGMVSKFLGDGLLAIFGAPAPRADHAARACRTALAMQAAVRELNREFEAEGLPPIRIGVGLNSGRMVLGNLGSEQRFDYTVVGDPVNVAARLEEATKDLGEPILTSEETLRAAGPGFRARELAPLSVRGRTAPVRVYALERWEPVDSG